LLLYCSLTLAVADFLVMGIAITIIMAWCVVVRVALEKMSAFGKVLVFLVVCMSQIQTRIQSKRVTCADKPCGFRGTCVISPPTYLCKCSNEFVGQNCQYLLSKLTRDGYLYQWCGMKGGDRVCFSTYGRQVDIVGASQLCEKANMTLPVIMDDIRLSLFKTFIQSSQAVVRNAQAWIDIPSNGSDQWNWLNGSDLLTEDTGAVVSYNYSTSDVDNWISVAASDEHVAVCQSDYNPCDPSPCKNNQTCLLLADVYRCSCSYRYTGPRCESEMDYCYGVPCLHAGSCVSDYDSGIFRCECQGQFHGNYCEEGDTNICSPTPCQNGATCINGLFSYRCRCLPGYEGKQCETDVDECAHYRGHCHEYADCSNTNGSYECRCKSGFTGDGFQCADVDECTAGSHSCTAANSYCLNKPGSYECRCSEGFVQSQSGTGHVCRSDACNHCHVNATCVGNTACECNAGFEGDGRDCTDVDECKNASICAHDCVNSIGSYECKCRRGYRVSGSARNQCVDVDECAEYISYGLCDREASCNNTEGDYECRCHDGYRGSGVFCYDIDECQSAPCKHAERCVNTPGGFTCECDCQQGFRCGAGGCEDINECEESGDNGGCHQLALCNNVAGSYRCQCRAGTTGDGFFCEDINECEETKDICPQYANCMNFLCSSLCNCWPGYEETILPSDASNIIAAIGRFIPGVAVAGQYKSRSDISDINAALFKFLPGSPTTSERITICKDVDECKLTKENCHEMARCINTPGSFRCQCLANFTGDGFHCTDIDECAEGTADCHASAVCTNTVGGYECKCIDGYAGNGTECVDVDECTERFDNCHNEAICNNIEGSFNCSCLPGFTGDGVSSCADIDECAVKNGGCHSSSTCVNSPGSYHCACPPHGFRANGTHCFDVNECDGSDACPPFSTCQNTVGSFSCHCLLGYFDDGRLCTDINECGGTSDDDRCHKNATCFNTLGSYECSCRVGFVGDGVFMCTEIKECDSSPCLHNGTCIDEIGGYDCECPHGYVGSRCQEQSLCDERNLLEKCFKLFYWHVNFNTYVINASADWHRFTCSRSVVSVQQCIKDMNCVVPSNLQGLVPALVFFCESNYGSYPDHAECLMEVNRDLDCFGVYPQMIPLAFYYTYHMSITPQILYEILTVTQHEHLLLYSLSKHLGVSRMLACRHRRVAQQCGWEAAEWQHKFSSLLSQVIPKVMDVAQHPHWQHVLHVFDADDYSWAKKIADRIRLCAPALDMISASTQFTVVAISDDDHNVLCHLSPHEFIDCAWFVVDRAPLIDSYVIGPLMPVHDLICGRDRKAEFVKHRACLRAAGSSPDLVPCATNVTRRWQYIYNLGNTSDEVVRVEAMCTGMKQFMNCMNRVVRKECGNETAAWQWNATLAIMLGNEFDTYCLSNRTYYRPDDDDSHDEVGKTVSSADRQLSDSKTVLFVGTLPLFWHTLVN